MTEHLAQANIAVARYTVDALISNISVRESIALLNNYVVQTAHVDNLHKRADWFVPQKRPIMALWRQPAGTLPVLAEAKQRLDTLAQSGPTAEAITFRSHYPAPQMKEFANG